MSTITRIKGVIDNPNLPVISPEGLVNPIYGKYINSLADMEYSLTPTQASTVKAFVQTIIDNELADYIITMFPFIGNQQNTNAAKVPIFGDKLFDWADSFNGLSFNSSEINGITKSPATTLKVSDLVPDSHFMGVAFSADKKETSSISGIDRVVSFGDTVQARYQTYQSQLRMNLYYKDVKSNVTAVHVANDTLENHNDAGNAYYAFIVGDTGYSRYAEINGSIVTGSSSSYGTYPDFSTTDLNSEMVNSSTTNYSYLNKLTSLTFFKKVMTKQQLAIYMGAVKTLMTALGRTVSI